MPQNIAALAFSRENGLFQRNIRKQRSTFHFLHDKDLAGNCYERNVKNIYCQDSMKHQIIGNLQPEAPPYATEFCTAVESEHIFAVADEDGNVSIFSSLHTPSQSHPLMPLYKVHAHDNAIFDIAWIPQENVLITASGDKTAQLWDMNKGVAVSTFAGHSCSVRAVNVCKQNTNLFVTGSRDGNALLWDNRNSQPILRIQDAHVNVDKLTPKRRRRLCATDQLAYDSQQTVSCALFQDANTIVTAGTRDGTLKIWDVRKIKQTNKLSAKKRNIQPVETIPYAGNSLRRRGYTFLTFDSSSTNLYASCTDDSIYHYNLARSCADGKRQPLCRYTGHVNSSFFVRNALSFDDQLLLGGSGDSKAYIWNANGECEMPLVCLSSKDMCEVTSVAWCPNDITRLVTCSDDCVVRVWKMPLGEKVKKLDIDGTAETVAKHTNVIGCKCGCDFSPISVVSKHPVESSSHIPLVVEEKLITPQKSVTDTNSILRTPSRKLIQTSVTSLFTPSKTATPSSSTKMSTPSRDGASVSTPTSTEKWCSRPGAIGKENEPKRQKALKCLDNQMSISKHDRKESNSQLAPIDLNITPTKNWLLELSKKRKLENGNENSACKRQRRSLSSPSSSGNSNGTPTRRAKSISSFFKETNMR